MIVILNILPLYYIHSDMLNMFKYFITHWCVIRRERVNMDHKVGAVAT